LVGVRRLFAHRVLKTGGGALVTRGDARPCTDAVVAEDELLGRVAYIVRDGKCIQPSKRLSVGQRAIATAVQSSDFAARVVVGIHGLLHNKAPQS
jgi:predicted RNA-binding protein YlxR (DUF448 family)